MAKLHTAHHSYAGGNKPSAAAFFCRERSGARHENTVVDPGSFCSWHLRRETRAGTRWRLVCGFEYGRARWRQELRVCDVAAMLGRRARHWRKLFTQSVL